VIILSAALDLVGPNVPKGVVLLADVIPSFLTKLCAPYFIHAVPYNVRIVIFVGLSACGMLFIALTPGHTDGGTISTKMAGVIIASLSSGGGELSFLALTHFYGPLSLAAWGSGTGGAGLIGAGAYALATTTLGFSVKATLLASACLPAVMMISFFMILPQERMRKEPLTRQDSMTSEGLRPAAEADGDDLDNTIGEDQGLLGGASDVPKTVDANSVKAAPDSAWDHFKANLKRSRSLFFPLLASPTTAMLNLADLQLACFHFCLYILPSTPSTRVLRRHCYSRCLRHHFNIIEHFTRHTTRYIRWEYSYRGLQRRSSGFMIYTYPQFCRSLTLLRFLHMQCSALYPMFTSFLQSCFGRDY
jgi:CLN3 protein